MNVTTQPHLHQDWIDPHAIGIVRALQKRGFETYLVGGCVRDLLLNIQPKDFDIATHARPDQVKNTIHRAYVIGKRFRLVLVRRDETQFEVATFRRDLREDETRENLPDGDNIFGTPEEDAQRRDFTINALFYDPGGDKLIDFAEGLPDLENRWVRMIGDPMKRLQEDPIRILRALRLKHMICFTLDPDLRRAMQEMGSTLLTAVLPRRREEILKLLRLSSPDRAFLEALDLDVLDHLSPTLAEALRTEKGDDLLKYLAQIGAMNKSGLTPVDLFGLLVHAYVRAMMTTEVDGTGPGGRELLNNEKFVTWMRDELGMFKFEQSLTVKALHVESLLTRRHEFQKKGERRQRALLSNEAFPLGLKFAERDFALTAKDLHYWTTSFEGLRHDLPAPSANGRPKRRRTRRPRGSGPRAQVAREGQGADAVAVATETKSAGST